MRVLTYQSFRIFAHRALSMRRAATVSLGYLGIQALLVHLQIQGLSMSLGIQDLGALFIMRSWYITAKANSSQREQESLFWSHFE